MAMMLLWVKIVVGWVIIAWLKAVIHESKSKSVMSLMRGEFEKQTATIYQVYDEMIRKINLIWHVD